MIDTYRSMDLNPFIRALSLTGFEEFATRQGLNPAEMLRCASLPAESLRRQEGILSYRRYCALLELCQRRSDNALFGLLYGLHQGINVFGDLFYLISNTKTVGDALIELCGNFSLYNGAAEVGLEIEGGLAILNYRVEKRDVPGLSQAEELACGVAMQLMRTLAGGGWQPKAVLLRHQPLCEESIYLRTLGFKPTFATTYTGLEFDAAVLSLPLSAADETLHDLIAQHIGRIERLSADELPNYVKQLLRNLLPSGRATLEKIAGCMAFNSRTLQQRLAQEGTSFQRLLDETRQEMAHNYLEDPSMSVAQIARLLGYADSSAFSRAFKSWFGLSPLEWQKSHCSKRQPRLLRSRSLRVRR